MKINCKQIFLLMTECKISLLGLPGSGKTSIIYRYVFDRFISEYYDPGIEDTFRKEVLIDNELFILDILDSFFNEEFISLLDQIGRAHV